MIKRVIYVTGILAFALACTQQKGYQIDVNLKEGKGKLMIEKLGPEAWIPVDSAELNNGVAVLKSSIPVPGEYYLSIAGARGKTILFLENSKIQITGHADSLSMAKITGSVTHDEYKGLNDKTAIIYNELRAISKQAREAAASGDSVKAEELSSKLEEIYKGVVTLQEDFVKTNPASYATPYILSNLQYDIAEDKLESLVGALNPKLDTLQSIKKLKDRIAKLKTVAVGQIAPDFTQNDVNGNPVKFSDVYSKNELTLVDFWASWCGPCRQENPNVVAAYNQFKDKGFTVFGVSLDRDKEAWLKAIADDNLTWQHVSDLSQWNNQAAALYAVNSIPSSLIVDKTGKIVAKDKRGDELKATIAELLGKK